jgi:hypothetical protein
MKPKISEIENGQYTVEIDLKKSLRSSQISIFESNLKDISEQDDSFTLNTPGSLCSIRNGILKYKSETILPSVNRRDKEKILMVFGNPATHSIKNGMFYFSSGTDKRHTMWSKLQEAGLMKSVDCNTKGMELLERRKLEADQRRKLIVNGTTSEKYLIGLTTFYSFPTPVIQGYDFSNVAGVQELFGPILSEINRMEFDRILSYPFAKNATLVFVQKDTYETFNSLNGCIYWPAVSRQKGARKKGSDLTKMLAESCGHL